MFNSSTAGMVDRAIVMGVIAGYYEYGTYLKILEPIYDSVNNDTILVWGNTGFTCRTDLMAFEETDTLILVVRRVQNAHSELEHFTDYWISACATNYLYYSNNMVTGYIDEGISSMPYNDFVQMLQECLPTVSIKPQEETAAVVEITCYPNPVQHSATITYFLPPQLPFGVAELYDLQGQKVLYWALQPSLNPSQREEITQTLNLEGIPAGMYIWRLALPGGYERYEASGKLVVE
ncbi:T9SS C-terminal target domain-containing protein [Sphingobacteriales bacterium UPWRP_1]|nr:hypothetical protein BVG80_07120 [Sphingobacteriales bacterium TSM_CSM]PSJ72852.1 T9SS C-terminal target domain-containing protein [Sphingobacteriales bacterium UPWRP_1]